MSKDDRYNERQAQERVGNNSHDKHAQVQHAHSAPVGVSTITLDAGHGRYRDKQGNVVNDTGTTGGGKTESHLTYELSTRTAQILEHKYGYENINLTRKTENEILPTRFGTRHGQGTICVVHMDDRNCKAFAGTIAHTYPGATPGSKDLAERIKEITGGRTEVTSHHMGLIAPSKNYHPDAVFVEVANLSDPRIQKLAGTEKWLNETAEKLARGLHEHETALGRAPNKEILAQRNREPHAGMLADAHEHINNLKEKVSLKDSEERHHQNVPRSTHKRMDLAMERP